MKNLLTIIIVISFGNIFSQNLVPNNSFEQWNIYGPLDWETNDHIENDWFFKKTNFRLRRKFVFFINKMPDDISSCNDPNEHIAVIYYRDEIVVQRLQQQFFDGCGDSDGRIGVFPQNLADQNPFHVLNVDLF